MEYVPCIGLRSRSSTLFSVRSHVLSPSQLNVPAEPTNNEVHHVSVTSSNAQSWSIVDVDESALDSDDVTVITISEPASAATGVRRPPVGEVDVNVTELRCVVVDDEAPNRRIGSRYLSQLRVPTHHIKMLSDGAFFW